MMVNQEYKQSELIIKDLTPVSQVNETHVPPRATKELYQNNEIELENQKSAKSPK